MPRRRSTKAELASLKAELAAPAPASPSPQAPAPGPMSPDPSAAPAGASAGCRVAGDLDGLARGAEACLRRGVGRIEAQVARTPFGAVAAAFLAGAVIGAAWRRGR